MKWENDKNRDLKLDIFEMIRLRLPQKSIEKITIHQAFKVIDEMIDNLTYKDKE